MTDQVTIGSFTGTGAAVNVELGFVPDYIRIINVTDGDNIWEWFKGMTNGHAIFTRAVVDNATTGNSSVASITSNGVSAYEGSSSVGKGFTAGSAISESGKTFRYVAMRNAV